MFRKYVINHACNITTHMSIYTIQLKQVRRFSSRVCVRLKINDNLKMKHEILRTNVCLNGSSSGRIFSSPNSPPFNSTLILKIRKFFSKDNNSSDFEVLFSLPKLVAFSFGFHITHSTSCRFVQLT